MSSLLSVSGLRCAGGGWRGWAPTIPSTQAINSSAQTQSSSHLDPALDIYTDMQCCRYLDSIVIYSVDITWWLVLLDMSGGLLLPESAVPSWDPTLCYSAHHGWMPVTSCLPHRTLALISTLDCDLAPKHFEQHSTINSPHCQEFMVLRIFSVL